MDALVEKNSQAQRPSPSTRLRSANETGALDAAEDRCAAAESAARRADAERGHARGAARALGGGEGHRGKVLYRSARDAALSLIEAREREIGADYARRLATELARLQKDWAAASDRPRHGARAHAHRGGGGGGGGGEGRGGRRGGRAAAAAQRRDADPTRRLAPR